jgi:hypothetical protein
MGIEQESLHSRKACFGLNFILFSPLCSALSPFVYPKGDERNKEMCVQLSCTGCNWSRGEELMDLFICIARYLL